MICMGRQWHSWRDVKRCPQNHNPDPVLFFVTCWHHLDVKYTRFCRFFEKISHERVSHMNMSVRFTSMTSSMFILWLRLIPNIVFCDRRSWSPKWRWSPFRCVTDAWGDVAWHAMTPSQVELSGVKAQQKQLKDRWITLDHMGSHEITGSLDKTTSNSHGVKQRRECGI